MLHAVVIFLASIAVDPHHLLASTETQNSESILGSTYAAQILFAQHVFLFFPFMIPVMSGLLIFCAVVFALLVYFVMSLLWGAADQLFGIPVRSLLSSVVVCIAAYKYSRQCCRCFSLSLFRIHFGSSNLNSEQDFASAHSQ